MINRSVQILYWALGAAVLTAAGVAVAMTIWLLNPNEPDAAALQALESARLTDQGWYVWNAERAEIGGETAGLIFYPGGRVDYRAYAPALQQIASHGIPTVLVPARLNLMILSAGRAVEVFDNFPEVTGWVVGGHSVGAAAATALAHRNPELASDGLLRGLVLWAGYPAAGWDISQQPLSVLSVTAENDGILDWETYAATQSNLPADTRFVSIEGGNHANFGSYGEQVGDNRGEISRQQQQSLVAELTADWILALFQ